MRNLLVVAVLVTGCAAETETHELRADTRLRPAGDGWACFFERDGRLPPLCDRPTLCPKLRLRYAEPPSGGAAPYVLSACEPRAQVACLTFADATWEDPAYVCTTTSAQCRAVRELMLADKSVTDVSTCDVW